MLVFAQQDMLVDGNGPKRDSYLPVEPSTAAFRAVQFFALFIVFEQMETGIFPLGKIRQRGAIRTVESARAGTFLILPFRKCYLSHSASFS
jgi:hypothetical protein